MHKDHIWVKPCDRLFEHLQIRPVNALALKEKIQRAVMVQVILQQQSPRDSLLLRHSCGALARTGIILAGEHVRNMPARAQPEIEILNQLIPTTDDVGWIECGD